MSPRPVARSVAVVGGGIGGLTAALALLQAGFDVRVYEQAHTLPMTGAGIQLAPNCTRVLARLGLLPKLAGVAVRPGAFEFRRWDDGRLLSQTPLGDSVEATYGAPYLHAHRGDLAAVLADAVPADRIELGRRCVDVVHRGEHPEVVFADGSRAAADVVVGADGIHSAVRQALSGVTRARFTGHVAYRGLVPAERIAHLGLQRRCTVRLGPGAHFVHYFVGGGRLLNVVCVAEERAWRRESWTDRADVAEVRAAFRGWHPLVRELIDAMDVPLKWALFDRDPLPSWSHGAVALLGDACHPMLPYGAQGYAQAVEDAAALAACLAADVGNDVATALRRYGSLRQERAARVQAISRANGVRFHLADGPEQELRDAAMASSFGLSPEIDWLYGHDIDLDVTTPA
jgi:salicylate hydroxylase